MLGEIILHYKILEKLGEGGMGVVYLAEDLNLERKVAIKFLPRHIAGNSEERERFRIEAKAAAALNHPNIATIHAIEESGEDTFIVMEFIDGIELKEKIKSGPIPTKEAINIAIQIAEGLGAAHKEGIVHRDIKSQNIMITRDGKVKVMDFGLAKVKGGTQLTKVGSTVGTAAYMSPEQAKGEDVDSRTDIWSFGVVLYEMITGKLPFKGEYDQAMVYSIINDEPEFPNKITPELNYIINKAIAKERNDRYQNADEFLNDLTEIKSELTTKSITGEKTFRTKAKSSAQKKNRKWIVPSAIIGFIIFLVAAYLYFHSKSEETTSSTERKMIVVLPFENLGSQDDKYFADGVTDEITSKLASIGNIGVIATSSAEKLVKANKSIQEIGKELNVDYVLNGSIRWAKSGKNESRVRITPQLIRISDNTIVWSDSYDKVLNDIFAVQNEIAQKVVDQLGGSLANNQIQKETPPTQNLNSYDFYLKGLSYEARGSYAKSDIQNSINLFKKAMQLDPGFAQAYARLSRGQASMYWFYYDRSDKNVKEAYNNAQKSFNLNPNLAEAHLALGYFHYWCKLEYKSAIKEFSEALKIQPNNATAYFSLGVVYRRMGKFDLAIQNMLKGSNLDPLSNEYSRNLGETYGLTREYYKAISQYEKVIELSPDMSLPKVELAQIYIFKGDLRTASELMGKIKDENYLDIMSNLKAYLYILNRNFDNAINELKSSDKPYEKGQFRFTPIDQMLGLIYKYKNDPALSKKYLESSKNELEKMLKDAPQDERLHSSFGITYAALGLKDKAIAEGKKGIELLPLEKEAYRGYYRQLDMAIIYTLIGDNNNALKQIDFILSIPGSFSVSLLKLDPVFDSLRDLPGYKAIINKYE